MSHLTSIAKKTKAELVEEYNKLLNQYEELKMKAKLVHEPQHLELVQKAKAYTTDKITQSITDLKVSISSSLDELTERLLQEMKKFDELQQAIEISRKNLELHYHVQVAADTLENLIQDYEMKKKQLEMVAERERQELEDEMAKRKRDHEREQEEYAYTLNRKRQREQEQYEEERAKREKEMQDRETAIKNQEGEIQRLRQEVERIPQIIAQEVEKNEKEMRRTLDAEWMNKLESIKKDWQAEKRLYELTITNLQGEMKRQAVEINALKQEADRATKKAQELAIKVIESGTEKAEIVKQPISYAPQG